MRPNPQFLSDLVTFTEEIPKGKSCKLCNKYMIASTQITNTEILAFIAVLISSYGAVKFCL